MQKYVLAIDIGATSGRHILGKLERGKVIMEEVYRFPNGFVDVKGQKCWDTKQLFKHIIAGMKKCAEMGKIPSYVGMDTWGVDYVLLDENDQMIGNCVAYRDSRTEGMDKRLEEKLSFEQHFRLAGTAKQPFNTVYQLMADEGKKTADSFLFIPSYLSYLLTGKKKNEYTFASTAGLMNANTRDWDPDILKAAEIPEKLFGEKPCAPGTMLGVLLPEIQKEVGYNCEVILPCTHDTGSAFMAVPARDEKAVYLSSGTWSLLGTVRATPITGKDALDAGFTNEGGFEGNIRFLQNIMGMWMIECIRKGLTEEQKQFDVILKQAKAAEGYSERVNVTDNRFMAPKDMQQ